MSSSVNKIKYEQRIQNEINSIFRTKLNDTRFSFVSITKVELNKDMSVANVYWDTFDDSKRGDITKAIDNSKGKIRSLLAKVMDVRAIPLICFHYDSQYVEELKITKLLEDDKNDVGDSDL